MQPHQFTLNTPDGDEPWVVNQQIFDVLVVSLRPGTIQTPTDAAKAIDQLFPLNRPKEGDQENEEPASFLFEMWGVVVDIAEQIPWNDPRQDSLVDIIHALRDLPDSRIVPMGSWGDLQVWADLPLLGPVLTETVHAIRVDDTPEAQQVVQLRQQNFTAFEARLTKSGLADRARHFALHHFREALEQEPDPRSRAYQRQGPRLDVHVPLAAIWILLAGNVVFAHCLEQESKDSTTDVSRGERTTDTFSLQRWKAWKKSFEEIGAGDHASEKTKGLAGEALRAMERIESRKDM